MTAPLRRVGDLERYLKQRFQQGTAKTGRLNGQKINSTLHGVRLESSSPAAGNDLDDDLMLTPRAARILQDLKRVTEKR